MGYVYELSWIKSLKQWRKRYCGKTVYFGTGKGRSDRASYLLALEKWKAKKEEIDRVVESKNLAEEVTDQPLPTPQRRRLPKTLKQGVEQFVSLKTKTYLSGKSVGKPDLSAGRVNNIRRYLELLFSFFGPDTLLTELQRECFLRDYFDHLQTLSLQNVGTEKRISLHTAKQRLQITKQFVRWCFESRLIRDFPRNFNSRDITINIPLEKIRIFRFEDLRNLFDFAEIRTKTFLCLALNCGFTQSDISALKTTNVDWKNRRISFNREKTGVLGNFKLWDLTFALIRATQAATNKEKYLFLNANGSPLLSTELIDGKFIKSDNVKCAWKRLKKKVNLGEGYDELSFKHLRKTSAYWIEKETPLLTQVFLAHTPKSIAHKFYVSRDFENLDTALLKLDEKYHLGRETPTSNYNFFLTGKGSEILNPLAKEGAEAVSDPLVEETKVEENVDTSTAFNAAATIQA